MIDNAMVTCFHAMGISLRLPQHCSTSRGNSSGARSTENAFGELSRVALADSRTSTQYISGSEWRSYPARRGAPSPLPMSKRRSAVVLG